MFKWVKQFNNEKSFTLVEFLVVIGIITILSGLILTGHQGRRSQLALQRSANKLVQDIRLAQEMAMSAQDFRGSTSKGGYGIYLATSTPDRYILFADCNQNNIYNATGTETGWSCASSTVAIPFPERVAEIEFERGVEISSLFTLSSTSTLRITFIPPDPTTVVNQLTTTSARIILRLRDEPSITRTIQINPAGLIFIE